jgi:hypothetical protein
MFDMLEQRITAKELLQMKNSKDSPVWPHTDYYGGKTPFSCYTYEREVSPWVKEVVKSDKKTTNVEHRCWGNWEIANVFNAYQRLIRKQWDKIIIILLDWEMRTDTHWEHPETLPYELFYSWRSCRKFNNNTYKQVIQEIEQDWVQVVAFGIDTNRPSRVYKNFQEINASNVYDKMVWELKRIIWKK